MNGDFFGTVKKECDAALAHLEEELKKVRTGRAHPSMLDGIMVTVYGAQMPLVGVAGISAPEPQLLQISPFDPTNIQAVAKAIRDDQSLGFNPVDDGRIIRVQIPALTTERRQQIAKQLGEKSEESLVRMRTARHEVQRLLKKAKDDKEITQDDEHSIGKQIDEMMADMKQKVEALIVTKEKEVMTVQWTGIIFCMSDQATTVPRHLGIILDGNRRWAKLKGKTSYQGHLAGYKTLKEVCDVAFARGIEFISVYVFSTENWARDKDEVSYLMKLALKIFHNDIDETNKKGIRVKWFGETRNLSNKHVDAITKSQELTKNNKKGTLCICFNYGGQQEIVDATKKLVSRVVSAEDITVEMLKDSLYHPDVPEIDIIVRTSGEQRISNFMLWRAAYSELMFVDKHWPDFSEADVDDVISEYSSRQRRFGVQTSPIYKVEQ